MMKRIFVFAMLSYSVLLAEPLDILLKGSWGIEYKGETSGDPGFTIMKQDNKYNMRTVNTGWYYEFKDIKIKCTKSVCKIFGRTDKDNQLLLSLKIVDDRRIFVDSSVKEKAKNPSTQRIEFHLPNMKYYVLYK